MSQNSSADALRPATEELSRAREAMSRMEAATTLREIESAWSSYLEHINRVWAKTESACKADSKFRPWQGAVKKERKADMLLKYLFHARNSDTHTLTRITSQQAGGYNIAPRQGSGLYIKQMLIGGSENGGTNILYEGSPAKIELIAPHVRLERVRNRDEWYTPPVMHLGQQIQDRSPLGIARLGLEYYENFLFVAREKFFPS